MCCGVHAQGEPGAQGNIHLGALQIHPLFSMSESYDSNIFDVPDSEVSDLITIYSPGLNLSLPIRGMRSELNVGYLSNFNDYRENPDQSTLNQYIAASFKTAFPRGLGISLNNRFEDTEQPPTFDAIYGELIQRTRRKSNNFSTTVSLPQYFARFDTDLHYANSDNTYEGYEGADYTEHEIGAILKYKLFTKVYTLVEFNTGRTSYETGVLDSVFYESLAGIQFKETAKTTGIFKIGYRVRDYENKDYDQFQGVQLSLESRTQLTALTNISVLLRRSQEEALFTAGKNYYELNSLSVTLGRKLTRKIDSNISGYCQLLDFPAAREGESDIKYYTIGARFSVDYRIQKWLSANLSCWYDDRTSSSDNLGRKKNVVAFTIGAAF